ncbi:Disease resistance protein [Melia azedarach]|uniref:Disease resistance protein n=1 Tax=Melia azedarach TaxID=155640 RepID=A0ACC1Y6V4_MELAZ|nr:Disease resistance protein [Melia azedarach]
MTVGETIAIVTGVVGCVTAISTPFVRIAFDRCTKYLKQDEEEDEDNARNLQKEMQILQNITQILERRARVVPDQARLINDAEVAMEMIHRSRNIDPWDCFGICWCLADYRKSYLVGTYVSDVKKRVNKLRYELRSRGVDINEVGELGRHSGDLVGEQANKVVEMIVSEIMYDDEASYIKSGIIGVYGACGVGKTHVVTNACDRILEQLRGSIFFIRLEVSNEDDDLKLQKKIADKIYLKLPNNSSVQENADLLKSALEKKNNVLLVLDDTMKAFSLEDIGLPVDDIFIVTISRSFAVCCQMQCDKLIALRSLSHEEAYELLAKEIGIWRILSTNEIESILKKIAKECGGLPLSIVAAAKWLGTYFEYDNLVSTERSFKMECVAFSNLKYIENKIFQDLELSYEQLKHSRYSCTKECLLYCTMYPRNYAFAATELMKYWMGEGLLREVEGTDEKLGEAKQILEELKDASLLESMSQENGEEIVKMHPIVWDMAVKLEKENPRFFTKPGCRIERDVWKDLSKNVERVSLMNNNLKELLSPSSAYKFHQLSTLLLQGNPLDIQLDRDFFNSFPNLKILDLSNTRVRLQRESLSYLKFLNVLLLRNCTHFTCLPLLSELLELKVLDVSNSSIEELPVGKNRLIKLLSLKLSGTRVKNLPPLSELQALMVLDVSGCRIAELPSLSKLVSLMVLNVSGCPIAELPSLSGLKQLMVLDVSDCPIAELPRGMNHLTKLVCLNLSRTQVRIFPSDVLVKFKYLQQLSTIGCELSGIRGRSVQDGSAAWIGDVQKLGYLNVLEVTFPRLHLYKSYTESGHWRQLSSFKFCVGGFYKGKLKNNSLAFIKEFPDDQKCLLDNTSELLVMRCVNITRLTIPKLSNLKFLDVSYCMRLNHLFTDSVIDDLANLEEIVIAHCGNMVKLIEKDSSRSFQHISRWSLRKLTLFDLPQLQFMYHGDGIRTWSMEEIKIWNCPQLQEFPVSFGVDDEQNLISPTSLKEIRGDDSWLANLKRNSDLSVPFLERTLIKEPPPEELTSRIEMVAPTSDMASVS